MIMSAKASIITVMPPLVLVVILFTSVICLSGLSFIVFVALVIVWAVSLVVARSATLETSPRVCEDSLSRGDQSLHSHRKKRKYSRDGKILERYWYIIGLLLGNFLIVQHWKNNIDSNIRKI